MKAVAYARYSSDLRKPSSIGDQQALCRKYCARSGYTIIAEYADAAQPGSDTRDRLGYQALMNDARAGALDAVIVEAFDRLPPAHPRVGTAQRFFGDRKRALVERLGLCIPALVLIEQTEIV